MSILIITHSRDNHASQRVIEAIQARGGTAVRIDTDHYPERIQISSHFDGHKWHKLIRSGTSKMDLEAVSAIWYRRWYVGQNLPQSLGNRRPHCVSEAHRTLYGTIANMDVFQIDRWIDVRRADFKEVQVKVAAELGIPQPATLFSNDPDEVRHFIAQAPDGVVTKMQSSFAIYEQEQEKVVFTSVVDDSHLEQLDGLKYAPMMFQNKVEKVADVRSTVVGNRVFSAILQREDSQSAGIDWRVKGSDFVENWQAYQLPADLEDKLIQLARRFGLTYAAGDFVIDPQGEHQFLEINACGEWCWVADSAQLPIADALADCLMAQAVV